MEAKEVKTGDRFNRLTLIKPDRKYHWLCKCDCGKEKVIAKSHIINNDVRSCGCLRIETTKARLTKHGGAKTPLWCCWISMIRRCYKPNATGYKDYGGRGITVCDEWKNDFSRFREFALSNGYNSSLEIDRKDNNGNYEPSNCKWSTSLEQARNRRNVKLTIIKVLIIRNLFKIGAFTRKELAQIFNQRYYNICMIISNRSWC